MKKYLYMLALLLVLPACGGGGGGGGGYTPPSAPKQTTPQNANTSSPYYLPFANGNTWVFSTGGRMVDMGAGTVQCSCSDNGGPMERIALYGAGSSTIGSSFFFTKNTPAGNTQLTNIVGVESDANTNNILFMNTTAWPYGVPIMDDSPTLNETWNDGVGDISTITTVGGTLALSSTSQVIDVATNVITSGTTAITWSFAKGVGFTGIGSGGQVTTITSFSVNAASSTSIGRRTQSAARFYGHPGTVDLSRALGVLLR